jgi:hypothetical protein
MTIKELHRLRTLRARMFNERLLLVREIQHIFQPGTVHYYSHGDQWRRVTVVDVSSMANRIRVRGKTGTKYWIHLYRFLEEGVPTCYEPRSH